MKRYTTVRLERDISLSLRMIRSGLRLARGWVAMGEHPDKRRRELSDAAREARNLAELLERAVKTEPKYQWTMQVGRRGS